MSLNGKTTNNSLLPFYSLIFFKKTDENKTTYTLEIDHVYFTFSKR